MSETHFWNFWSMSWAPKHGTQGQKYVNLASRLRIFQGPRNVMEASPAIFQGFLGCNWPPPDHQNIKKKKWWGPGIFQKRHPKTLDFRFLSLYLETPSLHLETQIALVFLGLNDFIMDDRYTCRSTCGKSWVPHFVIKHYHYKAEKKYVQMNFTG